MPDWAPLRRARIFITGGTGFIGTAMVEAFADANRDHHLDARIVVLTRRPDAFRAREPRLAADPAVDLWGGDVRDFADPDGAFTHVIHGAADPHVADDTETIARGTARVLDFARRNDARRMLFVSSGAVITDSRSPYSEAKRAAEALCATSGMNVVVARVFAVIGPRIPLDGTFAAGNFIRNALAGRTIEIRGGGAEVRSYLYVEDCADWLWTTLIRGASGGAYNVGSDEAVTIEQLARLIAARVAPPVAVRVLGGPVTGVTSRYVPDIGSARAALGVDVATPLPAAIDRTLSWFRERPNLMPSA